jgi:hypothetical protein
VRLRKWKLPCHWRARTCSSHSQGTQLRNSDVLACCNLHCHSVAYAILNGSFCEQLCAFISKINDSHRWVCNLFIPSLFTTQYLPTWLFWKAGDCDFTVPVFALVPLSLFPTLHASHHGCSTRFLMTSDVTPKAPALFCSENQLIRAVQLCRSLDHGLVSLKIFKILDNVFCFQDHNKHSLNMVLTQN